MNCLTSREKEIALLIKEGLSNKHICRRLNLAEGTVKIHLHNIYTKLGIANRTTLAVMAMSVS
jgi:DNA-binding NarL/FixJ family response regulator